MRRILPLAFFLFVLTSAPAQEPVPQIIVPGFGRTPEEGASATQTHLRFSDYSNRIATVPEILSEQAGVHLTRTGGLEEATAISIRGSSADEVTILLDGIPLNSATGASVDLSPFMTESLESADVYRGSAPAEFGLFPSAGLVSLTSKKIKKGQTFLASAEYGSFNTFKNILSYSKAGKRSGFLIANTYARTDGDFTFLDDNGTPVNKADDRRVKRQNNASQTVHPFVKVYYDFDDDTRLEWVAHLIRKDSGVPGLAANQSQSAHVDLTEGMTAVKLSRDHFLARKLSLETLTYLRLAKSQYSDLKGEIGLGGAQDNDDDTILFGQKFSLNYTVATNHSLDFFSLYQFERFTPEDFMASPTGGQSSRRHQWNAGAGYEGAFFNRRFFVNPAVWVENVFNRLSSDDPSFGALAGFLNSQTHHAFSAKMGLKGLVNSFLSLQAHVSRNFRFPSFPELFGDRGGVVGNPFLVPQKSLSWDAGLSLSRSTKKGWFNRGFINIVYFDRRVTDLIQFQQKAGFARAENTGKAHIRGLEIETNAEFFRHLGLTAGYTYQIAKDNALYPGLFLTGRPRHELNAKAEVFCRKARAFFGMNWMSATYLDPLNTRVINDRIIFNSGVSYQISKKLTAYFEAKNLTNEQIEDIVGFPLPGRSFFGRLSFSL